MTASPPPSAEPDLSDSELDRYARHIVLREVGAVGQRRLKRARVAVVGAGAIGGAVLPSLAGAGVGRLKIVDPDALELSNLHRQLIYREDQVGKPKAVLAANHLVALNSAIEASAAVERLDSENARALLGGHDLVIDGSDNFATRLAVNEACVALQIPLVSAAAAQFQGQLALLRGWERSQPCYRCFVGDAFDTDDCDSCAELGVLGALTGIVGHFAALLAIRAIVGIGRDSAGELILIDGTTIHCRNMRLPKDPNCRTCGGGNAADS